MSKLKLFYAHSECLEDGYYTLILALNKTEARTAIIESVAEEAGTWKNNVAISELIAIKHFEPNLVLSQHRHEARFIGL